MTATKNTKKININKLTRILFFAIILPLGTLCWLGEAKAQNIGINGTGGNAHPSALLDIDAVATPSLGLLIPRIALQAINLSAPVTSPATSLLVYNTASAGTSTNAVSAGYYYWDGAKWVRFAYNPSGNNAEAWTLFGNVGTNPSTNFIGTTDAQDLVIKVNNTERLRVKQNSGSIWTNPNGTANTIIGNLTGNSITGNNNSFYGYRSGDVTTSGAQNTFLGAYTGITNTTGVYNTFLGYAAGYYSTGDNNTFLGAVAGFSNSTGIANTAVGTQALQSNTTGGFNTAVGTSALYSNTIGSQNVANGYTALYSNVNGNYNIASGQGSLYYNTSGSNNVGYGFNTLRNNTTGNHNVAIGNTALDNSSTGQANIGIGINSGLGNTTGSYNIFLGANADATSNNFTNATAIGFNAKVGQSNALILGGTGADAVNVGIGTSTPAEKLEINGNLKFGGLARLYNASSNLHIDASSSGALYLDYYTGSAVYFGNGASGATGAWESSGRVGIGTTGPTEKLEVQGSVKIVDGTQGSNKVLTSDATGKASWVQPAGGYLQRYTLQSNQTYPNSIITTMDFPTMTLPYSGKYLINFKSFFLVPSTQEYSYYIRVLINGSAFSNVETYNYVQAGTYFNVTDIYTLIGNAGDVITLDINPVTGGTSFTTPLPSRVTAEFLFLGQ